MIDPSALIHDVGPAGIRCQHQRTKQKASKTTPTTTTMMHSRRSIAALLAIGAASVVGMLPIQAFPLYYHQHLGSSSSSSSQPQRRIERTTASSSCITSTIVAAPALMAYRLQENNEPEPRIPRYGWGRWRRCSRPGIVWHMTTQDDPAAAPPPLFQEMPTQKKSTTSTARSTTVAAKAAATTNLLFQDQAKPLRIENNSVVSAAVADPLVGVAAAAPGTTRKAATPYNFAVGDVVRVVMPNLRAYQVPTAGRGRYEKVDNKDDQVVVFVSDPTFKYLIVPIGLQGTVEKVYDDNNVLSANLPIRVSFVVVAAADNDDDDNTQRRSLQPPVDFSMHFAASELELVTPAAAAVPEESS
jgi:hypothetical protein